MQRSNRGKQILQNDANKHTFTNCTFSKCMQNFLHPTFSRKHLENILSDFSIIHISVCLYCFHFSYFPGLLSLLRAVFYITCRFYNYSCTFLLCAPTSSSYYWYFPQIGLENLFLFQQMVSEKRCLAFRNCCISSIGGQSEFYDLFSFILFFIFI